MINQIKLKLPTITCGPSHFYLSLYMSTWMNWVLKVFQKMSTQNIRLLWSAWHWLCWRIAAYPPEKVEPSNSTSLTIFLLFPCSKHVCFTHIPWLYFDPGQMQNMCFIWLKFYNSHLFFSRNFMQLVFSAEDSGRVLKYNPRTKETTVLIHNLQFPNGLSLSKDGSFFIFCEGSKGRWGSCLLQSRCLQC